MTWRRDDSTKRTPTDPLSTGRRTPAPPRDAVPEQPMLVDENNEPTMSVFAAMDIEHQGFWGEQEPTRFPAGLERELMNECGWLPERSWDVIRRYMTRDVQAI